MPPPLLHQMDRTQVDMTGQLCSENNVAMRSGNETPSPVELHSIHPLLYDSALTPVFLRLAMDTHDGQHIPPSSNSPLMHAGTPDPVELSGEIRNGVVKHRLSCMEMR